MDMEISNGIAIKRVGDLHPQGRDEIKTFEYREGQPVPAYFGKVFDLLFGWAEEKGVDIQQLLTNSNSLRQLVEQTGGRVGAGRPGV